MLLRNGRAQAERVSINWYDGEPADPIRPEDVEQKFIWRVQGLKPACREIIDTLRSYDGPDYTVQWLPRPVPGRQRRRRERFLGRLDSHNRGGVYRCVERLPRREHS